MSLPACPLAPKLACKSVSLGAAVVNWRNTNGAFLTTSKNFYNELGNLIQTQDPLLHNTFYDYTDNFSTTGNVCIPTGGTAQAFVSKITNHLGQFVGFSYYSCSSAAASEPRKGELGVGANASNSARRYRSV